MDQRVRFWNKSTRAIIRGCRAHAIRLIAYARQPLIIARVDVSCATEGLNIYLNFILHLNGA